MKRLSKFVMEEKLMLNIFKKNDESLWKFSVIPGIEESTFNKVLERFYDLGIAGLVRENIQNSLDGKIPGETNPVIVTIRTGKVSKNDIPGLEDIKERIGCLEGHNSYTKETTRYCTETTGYSKSIVHFIQEVNIYLSVKRRNEQ